jgi:glycosyltransferase involved in cell wall biosynthesis
MQNRGIEFLKQALDSLQTQTCRDFEVVISDDSEDNLIEEFIKDAAYVMDVRYVKNLSGKKGSSDNLNNAVRQARYEIIKPIFQDDWIVNNCMIENIIDSGSAWGALGYKNSNNETTYVPKWNNRMLLGINTIGAPTGIWFKKTDDLFFDENLSWLMDCEFYYRLYTVYGKPFILNGLYYVSRIWDGAVSYTINRKVVHKKELSYLRQKYKQPLTLFLWRFYSLTSKYKRKLSFS